MTLQPPPPTRRSGIGLFAVIGISVMVVCGICLVGAAVSSIFGRDKPQAISTPDVGQPARVDAAELAAFWDSHYSKATWYGLTSIPTWDGNALTAKTSLFADADAVEPAKSMCVAMSMYWVTSGREFQFVRVLDRNGEILVSRRTQTDSCTWRR